MEREIDMLVRMTMPDGRRVNYVPEELYLAEKARADAAEKNDLLAAVEAAAGALPDHHQIIVTVENGAAYVEWYDGEKITDIDRDESLAGRVRAAIDAAMQEPGRD